MLKIDSETGTLEAQGGDRDLLIEMTAATLCLITSLSKDNADARNKIIEVTMALMLGGDDDELLDAIRANGYQQTMEIDIDAIRRMAKGTEDDETT